MYTPASAPLRLLVIEPGAELQCLLLNLLTDEGCETHVVASVEAGLNRVDDLAFALILADLSEDDDVHALTAAQVLRRRSWPTPVGLLLKPSLVDQEAGYADFAFALPVPCDLTDLLTLMIIALYEPIPLEDDPRARIIRRYFAALGQRDWDAWLALCTETVSYSLSDAPPFSLTGKAALRAYAQEALPHFPAAQFEDITIYAHFNRLAARYTSRWMGPDGPLSQSGTVIFLFEGERIADVRVRLNTERICEPLRHALARLYRWAAGC